MSLDFDIIERFKKATLGFQSFALLILSLLFLLTCFDQINQPLHLYFQ